MDVGSSLKEVGTSTSPQGQSSRKMSEIEMLQHTYKEKSSKIQELKIEIEQMKHVMEKNYQDHECGKDFKALSKKYDRLRTEYYSLLPKKEEPENRKPS